MTQPMTASAANASDIALNLKAMRERAPRSAWDVSAPWLRELMCTYNHMRIIAVDDRAYRLPGMTFDLAYVAGGIEVVFPAGTSKVFATHAAALRTIRKMMQPYALRFV